jgi:hypothetical protein
LALGRSQRLSRSPACFRFQLHNRPNLRITGDSAASHRVFPSTHPGGHVEAPYVMNGCDDLASTCSAPATAPCRISSPKCPCPHRRSIARCHIASVAWPRSVDHARNVGVKPINLHDVAAWSADGSDSSVFFRGRYSATSWFIGLGAAEDRNGQGERSCHGYGERCNMSRSPHPNRPPGP